MTSPKAMLEYLGKNVSPDYERVKKYLKNEENREEGEDSDHEPFNTGDTSEENDPEDEESCSDMENEMENLVIL